MKDTDQIHDALIEQGIATYEEICLVCSIKGGSLETYEAILFARTGYRSLEQMQGVKVEDYNTITIVERNGTSYTESVGWSFDEAARTLLGKRGKNGSPICSVSMECTSSKTGFPFTKTQATV